MKAQFFAVAIVLMTACSTVPPASENPPPGFTAVEIAAYDSDRGIGWAASREDYEAARVDPDFRFEQFTYVSDGLTVGAYLYRPRESAARPLPVIVLNRGSWLRPKGFAGEMLVMAHRFAKAGFMVIAPHYRGSNGWEGKDELGGAELHDLMMLPALYRTRSALRFADRIEAPVLIMHGGADEDIPLSQ